MMTSRLQCFPNVIVASTVFGLASISAVPIAGAAIIQVPESAFNAQAGLITFSEKLLGTVDPVYSRDIYGGGVTSPNVFFGGAFVGQTVGQAPFPDGAAQTGVVNGTPTNRTITGALRLDPNSPTTSIVTDSANPTSPVLSGSPRFNGPISIFFSNDVAGVGLDGGSFEAIGSTAITAFARNGANLGSVKNSVLGFEFLGLVTSDGTNQIAGLQFSLVGAEPAGFAIDNLRFGVAGQVTVPGDSQTVPEPFTIVGTLVGGTAAMRIRKKLKVTKKS